MEYTLQMYQEDVDHIVAWWYANPGWSIHYVYGVPRGGTLLAVDLSRRLGVTLLDHLPEDYNTNSILIVDDIVDSGNTRERYRAFPYFISLVSRTNKVILTNYTCRLADAGDWVHFWWEKKEDIDIQEHVTRMLEYIGEDPKRDGLIETPKRIVKSWDELYKGYKQDPAEIFKVFEKDGFNYDQMVLVKDITLYSMCEHHNLPFWGRAHVAYIPNDKVVGVSKLARLVQIFSRRMQIQERIGDQVTEAIMTHLKPKGAACIIEAEHLCMKMRGVQEQNSVMMTSSLKGVFLENQAARNELLELIKK